MGIWKEIQKDKYCVNIKQLPIIRLGLLGIESERQCEHVYEHIGNLLGVACFECIHCHNTFIK